MKTLNYLLIAALTILMCACRSNDPIEPDRPSIINPDDILVKENETLSADAQKQKLEQVAEKVITLCDVDEYEDIMQLCAEAVGYGSCIFDEYYDFSELEEEWENIAEDFFSQEEISDTETRYFLYLFLSNITGTVEFDDNKATYKKGSDIKVIFHEDDGDTWEAQITPQKLKTVYLGEWMDEYYGFDYDSYEEIWYTDYYNVTVEIPSSLEASLKRNGSTIAAVSFSIDHNLNKEGLDFDESYLSLNCEIQIDDLKFIASRAMVDADKGKVECQSALYKGDIFIFSESFSANADYELDEEGYPAEVEDGAVEFRINLLGELQVEGKCSDLVRMAELADAYVEDEDEFERVIDIMNSLIDIHLYYDCTSTEQASIELEPMMETDEYYGEYYYWAEPVIVFNDGSRYLFYEYFDEDSFSFLIKKFERMVDEYIATFEDYEDIFDE
jgi:hypothetical protein